MICAQLKMSKMSYFVPKAANRRPSAVEEDLQLLVSGVGLTHSLPLSLQGPLDEVVPCNLRYTECLHWVMCTDGRESSSSAKVVEID